MRNGRSLVGIAAVFAFALSVPTMVHAQGIAQRVAALEAAVATLQTQLGVSGYEVLSFGFDVVAGNTGVLEQACPGDKKPTGGGFYFPYSNLIVGPDVTVIESSPRVTVPNTNGWRVVANNRTGITQRMEVWVVCANASD